MGKQSAIQSYNHNSKPSPASGLAAGAEGEGRNMMWVMAGVMEGVTWPFIKVVI